MPGRCRLCEDAPVLSDRQLLEHLRVNHESVALDNRTVRARATALITIAVGVVVAIAVLSPLFGMLIGLFVRGFNFTA